MLWWPELGFFALLLALCVSLLAALRGLVLARRLPAWHPRRWAWAQGGWYWPPFCCCYRPYWRMISPCTMWHSIAIRRWPGG
ncbi:hypothetical protein NMD70_03350 [Edwardsiella tarda]